MRGRGKLRVVGFFHFSAMPASRSAAVLAAFWLQTSSGCAGGDGDDLFRRGDIGQPGGGDDGFEAHAAVLVGRGLFEQGGVVGDAVRVVAQDAHGGGAGVVSPWRREAGAGALRPAGSGPTWSRALRGRGARIEGRSCRARRPTLFTAGRTSLAGMSAQFAARAVAQAQLGLLEIIRAARRRPAPATCARLQQRARTDR